MILKQLVLSNQAKDQLARLKGKTGIDQWNTLCRWAFCLSLREPTPPADVPVPADSNVQIEWHTLLGEYHELYEALLIQRCVNDGLPTDRETLAKYFRLHVHRGIAYLTAPNLIRTTSDLLRLTLEETGPKQVEEELNDALS